MAITRTATAAAGVRFVAAPPAWHPLGDPGTARDTAATPPDDVDAEVTTWQA